LLYLLPWPYTTAKDQGEHKQYQEDEENDSCNPRGSTSDAAKSEERRDKRDHQKYDDPSKH
jgi:hypothetical protein